MIQAQNPEELQNQNQPKEANISKVPGFSTPVANSTPPTQTVKPEKLTPEWQKMFFKWWHKLALVMLIGHGLLGLWESIKFIAIEYPALNRTLELHQVETNDVSQLLNRVIITLITTFVNILFAVRLSKVKEATAHNIDLIVATFLIISTKLIQNLLVQLDLVNYIFELFSK